MVEDDHYNKGCNNSKGVSCKAPNEIPDIDFANLLYFINLAIQVIFQAQGDEDSRNNDIS